MMIRKQSIDGITQRASAVCGGQNLKNVGSTFPVCIRHIIRKACLCNIE